MTDSLLPDRLPDGWRGARLRWVSRIYAGGTPSRERPDYWHEGTIPWLNSGAVNDWAIDKPSEYITEAGLAGSSARWIPPSSVVMALAGQGKTKATAARLEIETTCNQSMAALVPGQTLDYRFLHFWLVANYERIRNLGGGDLRDGLNLQMVGDIEIPVPPVEEQRRIADFLDDQVGRIAEVRAERLGQVDLVDARWQSSLDEMFPTLETDRDLNYVSARHRLRVLPGYAFPSDGYSTDDSQVRLLRGINVGVGQLVWDETVYWEKGRRAAVTAFELQVDDLVLGMDRPWISGGMRIAVVRPEDLPALLLQRVAKLIPSQGVHSEYLYWAYQASAFRHQIETELSGVSVPHLSAEQILEYRFPDRSLSDQRAIAKRLTESSAESARAKEAIRAGIDLLEERKRALITAAVTGEMDVTTARPINMGQWVPGVGASVEAPAAAQASSIGGIG